MTILISILSVALCYLIGSVPSAYVLVKLLKGTDIRTIGSGNVGATNAGRALGLWAFFVVLMLDALKGFLPVMALLYMAKLNMIPVNMALIGAFAVIIGHTYSVFLNFKGGKGVATGLGVFIALAPVPVAIACVVFIFVFLFTRMVSAGSVCGAVALGIAATVVVSWVELIVFVWIMVLFVVYKHIPNIKRIIAGNENRINFRK